MAGALAYKSEAFYKSLALFFFSLIILLGIFVIYGWYTHDKTLIQIYPNFAPMQYNTALCFLLSAVGFVFSGFRKYRTSRILATAVGAISTLTLLQYITDLNLYIDTLFVEGDTVTTRTSHVGRMAPNTAISFLLASIALFISHRFKWLAVIGISLLAMSVLSLMGYAITTGNLHGWGTLTRMAIHTSFGFFALGVGTLLLAFSKNSAANKNNLWNAAPVGVLVVMLSFTALAAISAHEFIERDNRAYFEKLVSKSESAILKRLQLYKQTLQGGGRFVERLQFCR